MNRALFLLNAVMFNCKVNLDDGASKFAPVFRELDEGVVDVEDRNRIDTVG